MTIRPCLAWSLATGLLALTLAPSAVHAQLAPSQPIKIVVGAAAGGIGDIAARIVAQKLTEDGHPAIVENRRTRPRRERLSAPRTAATSARRNAATSQTSPPIQIPTAST